MEKLAGGYRLVEGPLWVAGKGLFFTDGQGGGVFCVDASGNVEQVFAYRRGIGGLLLHEQGGLVVSGRNMSWKSVPEGTTLTLLDRDEEAGIVGFNDITADAAGRVYAGSLAESAMDGKGGKDDRREGDLYLIDLDGSARIVARGFMLTNGLGFSPDGKTLYHSDSPRYHVNSYSVNEDGSLGEKQVFVTTEGGTPDGLAISEDGRIWVALVDAGGVAVYRPDGSLDDFIAIPDPMCTNLCFGGEDLRDLYIVSGSKGADSDQAGSVYVTRASVAGLPVPVARVPLPPAEDG